jgi:hypothetical protein
VNEHTASICLFSEYACCDIRAVIDESPGTPDLEATQSNSKKRTAGAIFIVPTFEISKWRLARRGRKSARQRSTTKAANRDWSLEGSDNFLLNLPWNLPPLVKALIASPQLPIGKSLLKTDRI